MIVDGWLAHRRPRAARRRRLLPHHRPLKDIFISGGESVAPAEVEAVLLAHPAVADVAVAGVPDDRWGEVGVAWVVTNRGLATDAAELLELRRGLARALQVPREVRFVDALPRSTAGKCCGECSLERVGSPRPRTRRGWRR